MHSDCLIIFDDRKRTIRTAQTIKDECSRRCRFAFDQFQAEVRQAIQTRDWQLADIGEAEV